MFMVRLIYASRPSEECSVFEIIKIIEAARKNNPAQGVTGMLFYDRTHFVQWIEGPREHINALFQTICHDSRHRDVTLLDYAYIDARQFNDWSMAYISLDRINEDIVNKYKVIDTLDPYAMGGEAVKLLLMDIHAAHTLILNDTPEEKA